MKFNKRLVYNKELLISILQKFYTKHNYVPTCESHRVTDLPHSTTFILHFGSWNNALIAAGLLPNTIPVGIVQLICTNCNKKFERHNGRIPSYQNSVFCCQSCSASYNNTHKKYGIRRSKLECWLESELTKLYPNEDIHFNRKDAINSELDIYFPELKLAFELNGIYHYEPIHGPKILENIKNNDNRKFQACLEQGIELCIIDASKLSYFKPISAKKYLDIIVNIINIKIGAIKEN